MTKRIVVATDGSAGAREAVEAGLELARRDGAIAIIVHVLHASLPVVADSLYEQALSAAIRAARAVVDDALARAVELDVEADSEILEGDPATEIVRLARERDAALIVVGSPGGSVSGAVVRRADRPVLVAEAGASIARPAA